LDKSDNISPQSSSRAEQLKPTISPLEPLCRVEQETEGLLERAELINNVLYSIANAVNTTLNLEDLYLAIHKSLQHIIDVTNFFITIADTATNMLLFPYYVDSKDVIFPPISNFGAANTLTGQVVLQRKPLLFRQEELEERARNNAIQGSTPLIWLGVPLIIRTEVIGIIAVQSYTDPNLYSEKDLHLLAAVSDQIAIAIDRKRSIDQLQKSEEKYRNLFNNAQVGLFRIHDTPEPVIECNIALAKMFGNGDQGSCLDQFPLESVNIGAEKQVNLLNLVRTQGKITNLEFSKEKRDGSTGWFRFSADYSLKLNRIEGSVTDITEATLANEEKLRLQKELERSRKMEALGLLVSGVAHDLNNILAGIISYPELILLKHPDDQTLRPPLEAIQDSGKRAAEIVGDLLTLARSAASVRKSHDLHSLVDDYLESPEYSHLQKLYPDIKTRTNLNAASSKISCSSVHIKKCLMNLITNGFEAITGTGEITLSTTNTTLSDQSADDVEPCKYVVLSVSDSGTGIAEADQDHIFEPFYSRKKMGRSGTGLGLTVVWSTMQDHNGKVTIESTEAGTTFHLYFPVDTGELPGHSVEPAQTIAMGHGESILVVDDEPLLRDIACQILTTAGYSPTAVATGEEALEYLEQHSADLILLDMQMDPGINGYQTYQKIIKIHPGQKAIIASGFSESDDVRLARALGVGNFIKKPYTASQLSHIVAKELLK